MKKSVICLNVILCLMIFLSCGSVIVKAQNETVSADTLIAGFEEHLSAHSSLRFVQEAAIETTVVLGDTESASDIELKLEAEEAGKSFHSLGTQKTSANGQDLENSFEIHVIYDEERDKYTEYRKENGIAYMFEPEVYEFMGSRLPDISKMNDGFELVNSTEKFNEKECYAVKGKLNIFDIGFSGLASAGAPADISEDDLTADITLYFDRDTSEIEGIMIDGAKAYETIMSSNMKSVYGDGVNVCVDRFLLNVSQIGFDDVKEIKTPDAGLYQDPVPEGIAG